MPNCFKDYKKKHSQFASYLGSCATEKKNKFTVEQRILFCQYHVCWLRGQGISRNDINQISRNIPSLASEDLTRKSHQYDMEICYVMLSNTAWRALENIILWLPNPSFPHSPLKHQTILYRCGLPRIRQWYWPGTWFIRFFFEGKPRAAGGRVSYSFSVRSKQNCFHFADAILTIIL